MQTQVLREEIEEVWKASASSDELNAYMSIVDHIIDQPYKNITHLVFSSFLRMVNTTDITKEKLLTFIFYLINQAELLDVAYEFIDEDDSTHPVSLEQIKYAEKTGLLPHPDSGELLEDYQNSVFMYFIPSLKLKGLKGVSDV